MLKMTRIESAIQAIFTFFLCLLSNNICTIILGYEGVAKETENQAYYLLHSLADNHIDYRFLSC